MRVVHFSIGGAISVVLAGASAGCGPGIVSGDGSGDDSTGSTSTTSTGDTTANTDEACLGGELLNTPRIMILLAATSPMLNVGGMHGAAGQTPWDRVREVVAGERSALDAAWESAHVGLSVFGHNNPDEAKVLAQYGPGRREQVAWALDPWTSCSMPGCDSPYDGPTIVWSSQDGSTVDPPGFDEPIYSHMPQCGGAGPICSGSGRYVDLGLQLVERNVELYRATTDQPFDDDTVFANILITYPPTKGYSTFDGAKQALTDMLARGIETYVVAVGEEVDEPDAIDELEDFAVWGGGHAYFIAPEREQLREALSEILDLIACDTRS